MSRFGPNPLRRDTLDLWDTTLGLPEQMLDAVERSRDVAGLPNQGKIENVVVFGMGGSGIAGDVLRAVAGPFMSLPVVVIKSYTCPAFIDDRSLVICVSFSGNTEETLEAAQEAHAAGASVVCVTAGGQLAEWAASYGAPVVTVDDTIPMPRAAIGAVSVPSLMVLDQVGLFPGAEGWIDQAVQQLRFRREQLVDPDGEMATLARRIGRTMPLIYGSADLGHVAAVRWKNQVNENAKAPAWHHTLPEACHNELAGWGQNGDITRQVITLVHLRHDIEHPQMTPRFEFTNEAVREVVADIAEVRGEGIGALAQLFDLVLQGDVMSLHMASLQDVDPGPIPILDDLKAFLQD